MFKKGNTCLIPVLFGMVLFLLPGKGITQEIYKYQAQTRAISLLGFAPGSDTLISYGNDKTLNFHFVRDRLLVPQTGIAEGKVITEMATSQKGRYIAFKTWGNKIFITIDGTTMIDEIDSRDDLECPVFSQYEDNTMYFLADRRIMKWSWPAKQVVNGCLEQIAANAVKFALCNHSNGIVTVNTDNSVSFFNRPRTATQTLNLNPERKMLTSLAISRNDEYLALGFATGEIEIYNLNTGVFLKQIHEHHQDVSDLCFAPQGPYLVSRSSDWTVRIWYLPEGQQIFLSDGASTRPGVARAVVSADGKYLAVNKDQLTIQYFDLRRILSEWLSAQSEAAVGRSDFKSAEAYCSHSVEIFPGYDYYYKRGVIRLKLQKKEEALSDFNEALKFRALGKEALLERCKLFMEKDQFSDALTDCNIITRLYRSDSLSWGLKGTILHKLGKYSESGIAFDSAIRYSRNPDTYRYARALSQKNGGKYSEAIRDLDILIAKSASPEYLMNRGLCYYFSGNYPQAYADMKRLPGDYPGAKKYLAFTALQTGNYAEAQQVFASIQGAKSENDIMTGAALAFLLTQKSAEEPQQSIGKLLRLQPMNYDLHFLRGLAFVFLDDMKSACEIMSKVYKPDPDYVFSFRDTLQLNQADDIQKDFGMLLTCISDGIRKLKLDYSDITYAERQEDYQIRMAENQQKMKEVAGNCSLGLSASFRQSYFNVSTIVEIRIDSVKSLDASRKKFCYFVKGKKFFLKENSTYEQLLKDNWKTAVVKAEQRYSPSLKTYDYQNLVVSLKDIGVETPLFAENQVKPSEPAASLAKSDKPAAETFRGVKDLSQNNPEEKTPEGRNYLFMIGVNNYANWPKLHTPVSDVKAIESVLWGKYQFSKEYTIELLNEDFTKDNFDAKFEYLNDSLKPNDRLLIYYAGHGYKDPTFKKGYWIPYNARKDARIDYIKNDEIVDYIRVLKAKHIVLMMDACYSGSLVVNERGGGSASISYNKMEEGISRYALASGRDETVDDEIGETGHSPFAYNLLYFLNESKEDMCIEELSSKVTSAVGNNAKQLPVSGVIQNTGHKYGQFVFRMKR